MKPGRKIPWNTIFNAILWGSVATGVVVAFFTVA